MLVVTWEQLTPDTSSRFVDPAIEAERGVVREPHLARMPHKEVGPQHSCKRAGVVNIHSIHVVRIPASHITEVRGGRSAESVPLW